MDKCNEFAEGKKAGQSVGYQDGKSGNDSRGAFDPARYSGDYADGWEVGYEEGLKLAREMKKHT